MKNISINKVIRVLILSDFFLFFGVGLLTPIFAVFIIENIENEIAVVGYATSAYWIARVITVLPLSWIMDKMKGDKDEYLFMVIGTLIVSIQPLLFILSTEPWHIYLLQFISGTAYSMCIPAWRILFTNHIDKKFVGFEWSLEDVSVGIATTFSAMAGAFIASKFGFNFLFIVTAMFGFIATAMLYVLYRKKTDILEEMKLMKSKKAPFKIDTIK